MSDGPPAFRLFAAFHASHHHLLGKQHCADLLEQLPHVASETAFLLEVVGERLDPVEVLPHPRFVHREHHALAQHVGDNLQPLRCQRLQVQRLPLHALVACRIDADLHLLGFRPLAAVAEQRLQGVEKWRLRAFRDTKHTTP